MKHLSINDIDYYFNLIKKLNRKFYISEWEVADTVIYPIQFKLYYFTIAKILNELQINPKLYRYKMPNYSKQVIKGCCTWDEMESIRELVFEIVQDIYAAYGWDINHYYMEELYSDVCYDLDIDFSDIEEAFDVELLEKFKEGFTENRLKEFLADDYELHDEMVLFFADCITSHYFNTTDLYIYRNKKLGKYLSYVNEHRSYNKTPIGARIKKLLKYDLNPIQFSVPPYRISGLIDSNGDYVMSHYFFYAYDNCEYISEVHTQLERVVLIILLDQLLNMAYEELNLDKVVA